MILGSPFLWKLYAGYSVLILISCLIVGFLVSEKVEQDTLSEIRHSLQTRATLLKDRAIPFLSTPRSTSFQSRIKALGSETDTRITVIGRDGLVRADSHENPSDMDNHAEREEVQAAARHGLGTATRYSSTLGMKMMYLALAVQGPDGLLGHIRTALPLAIVDSRLQHLQRAIAIGAGLSALVALCLGLVFARHFVKPLASMTVVAEAMSRGDYARRLPTVRKDEIGKLARAFNRMAGSSQERTATISADRNKLSAILAGMKEGVIAINKERRILHLNAAAGRLLALSPAASLGKELGQVTDIPQVWDLFNTVLTEMVDTQKNLQLAISSQERVIEMHASPLHDGQGELVGAVAVLQDISELVRSAQIRREFVANASHELKTPITAIRGLVETLIDDTELSKPKRLGFLERIKSQSMRLSSLVTDLLALSRLESDGKHPARDPFDLGYVVHLATNAFVQAGEEKGIRLTVRIPDEPVAFNGDEEALEQAVSNLLDNALKYTPQGGQVWARLELAPGEVVIAVQDTGIGIGQSDRERIFERFYRVDKARSRELGGTGLGLSIVKHIALSHQGHLTVESEIGVGSTFRIILPR